jgi:hypothetical protein
MLISNPFKKILKMHTEKAKCKTILTNMSKSEKSTYFRHFFANNFFVLFIKLFQWIRNQCKILRILIPIFIISLF